MNLLVIVIIVTPWVKLMINDWQCLVTYGPPSIVTFRSIDPRTNPWRFPIDLKCKPVDTNGGAKNTIVNIPTNKFIRHKNTPHVPIYSINTFFFIFQ